MASTVQANNTLDTYPFSHAAIFRRSSNIKAFPAVDSSLHAFGLDGVSNIWQNKTNPHRQQHVASTATRRSDQPLLTISAGRLDTHTLPRADKWSLAKSNDQPHHRSIDPPMISGRARFNEGALLTPVSLSSADQSPSETVQLYQDVISASPNDGRTVLHHSNRWLNAPEFQPSRDLTAIPTLTQFRPHPTSQPFSRGQSACIDSAEDKWQPGPSNRSNSDFRPVLPIASQNTACLTQHNVGGRGGAVLASGASDVHLYHDRSDKIGPPRLNASEHPSYGVGMSGVSHGARNFGREASVKVNGLLQHNEYTSKSSEYQGTLPVAMGQIPPGSYKTAYRNMPTNAYALQHMWPGYDSIYGPSHNSDHYPNIYAAGQGRPNHFSSPSPCRHDDDRYTEHEGSQRQSRQVTRSPLLEEFRQTYKTRQYELEDIYGYIVEFSGDPHGSRLIQQKLEVASGEEKEQVFKEVLCEARQLMTDLFGNYVIQKMFEHGSQSQKKTLANTMKGHVLALSTQMYGCRVVQKALEHVLTEQQASLVSELDGHVLKAVEDQNGNHVIQRAIEFVPGEHIQFIVDTHLEHIHYLSKHAYGCRVIQRLLEYCRPDAKRAVLNRLHMHIDDLIVDAFGNYVVQHIIVKGDVQDRKCVIDKIASRLVENSMHKFASNVVEKALDYADDTQRRVMLSSLTSVDENGQSQVLNLLMHQYGNYVIQKCAKHLQGHALQAVLEEMEKYHLQLRKVSNGKQVAALELSCREARMRLDTQRRQEAMHSSAIGPYRTFPRPRFS